MPPSFLPRSRSSNTAWRRASFPGLFRILILAVASGGLGINGASAGFGSDELFVAGVRAWVTNQKILRRPHTLAELRADPGYEMKYREKPAHLAHIDEAAWQRFALSLADSEAAKKLAHRLPAVAAAARLSGDPLLLGYLREQLAELATWAPFQRPGWSGGSSTPGAWLGTGWAVRAITQCLTELPADALPPELRQALRARLEAEIPAIREDWTAKRTWFTRIEAVSSNQWVLPLEALALASLHAGLDEHRDDYEFAIAGLLRSLDAQGQNGECVEGMLYAAITFESLLSAARAAHSLGDDRLLSHPWFRDFPTWYVHHRQPGGFVVNAFDSQSQDLDWNLVARFVADLRSPVGKWVLQHDHSTPSTSEPPSLARFRAGQQRDVATQAPPTFAVYPVAARVNWVESLDAFAADPANRLSGFWMRGGHASDAHDHQDRGHVNFIVAGRPVLIEAGLASYGVAEHATHFKSVAGHNVLQVGAFAPGELTAERLKAGAGQILQPAHRPAPFTVHRLDEQGGEVSVDASNCYASVQRWVRTARWDARELVVRDEVELKQPDTILFRWHLGEPADAAVIHDQSRIQVGAVRLAYEPATETPLRVTVDSMPDHTLAPGSISRHATVVMATSEPTRRLVLTTRISLAAPPAKN